MSEQPQPEEEALRPTVYDYEVRCDAGSIVRQHVVAGEFKLPPVPPPDGHVQVLKDGEVVAEGDWDEVSKADIP